MRILLLTISYPPTLSSAARLFSELAVGLQAEGHQITVITSVPERYLSRKTTGENAPCSGEEVVQGIRVFRLPNLSLPKHLPRWRAVEHLFTALQYFLKGRRVSRQDVVIVYSPPLPLAMTGILLARRGHGKAIINIQDLYPQSVVDLGLLKNKFLVSLARRMERWVYAHADVITVHSEGNCPYVVGFGNHSEKVHVVPNWIDLEKYRPGPRENVFRGKHGFDDAFLVSYAGVMGFAQGVEDILKTAALLKKIVPEILFVLVGSGVAMPSLKELVRKENLTNVCFLPHLPEEEYIELLQASDISLVTLTKNLRTPVVPGKLPCIMAVGRPVGCSTPPTSDARRIVEAAKCGFWVDAGDPRALADALLALYRDPAQREKMGSNGRAYAEGHFHRKRCIAQYKTLIADLGRG